MNENELIALAKAMRIRELTDPATANVGPPPAFPCTDTWHNEDCGRGIDNMVIDFYMKRKAGLIPPRPYEEWGCEGEDRKEHIAYIMEAEVKMLFWKIDYNKNFTGRGSKYFHDALVSVADGRAASAREEKAGGIGPKDEVIEVPGCDGPSPTLKRSRPRSSEDQSDEQVRRLRGIQVVRRISTWTKNKWTIWLEAMRATKPKEMETETETEMEMDTDTDMVTETKKARERTTTTNMSCP